MGRLAGRNVEINANRYHWAAGAKVKANAEQALGWSIQIATLKREIRPIEKPVQIYIEWHEAPRRRDVDNIQSSAKYVLDALKAAGIIKDDNQTWVKQVWQKVVPDTTDFVCVELSEAGWELRRKDEMDI